MSKKSRYDATTDIEISHMKAPKKGNMLCDTASGETYVVESFKVPKITAVSSKTGKKLEMFVWEIGNIIILDEDS